ncbi:hypothetical protein OIU74_000007 [Salix koriyanagi]|uniref:Uncharacterized protein n=1 Tax=Salix koriyanagi TaxID=2511006 RepID=A0A9Q0WY59_9ROSI|nr:hypothetical protein OIU74_000007 [Salix koriyanagi]
MILETYSNRIPSFQKAGKSDSTSIFMYIHSQSFVYFPEGSLPSSAIDSSRTLKAILDTILAREQASRKTNPMARKRNIYE